MKLGFSNVLLGAKMEYKGLSCVLPAGYSVFVVGVADVDYAELQNIGSKPSERHIFVVDDFDAFASIQDNLVTFICETATSSKLVFMKNI